MTYDINRNFKKVEGVEKLLQYIRKQLQTTFDGEKGCYLKSYIGTNITDLDEKKTDILREVQRVEQQVIKAQSQHDYHIPEDERLKRLELLEIFNDGGRVNGRFKVVTQRGDEGEYTIYERE